MISALKRLLEQEHLSDFARETALSVAEQPPYLHDDFSCRIPCFESLCLTFWDGWLKQTPQHNLPKGIEYCPIAEAPTLFPEIFRRYAVPTDNLNPFAAFNQSYAQRGIFLYVAPHTEATLPIQILNLIRCETPSYIQLKHLIVLGENSRLQFIHCDDSFNLHRNFANHSTHIFVGKDATLDYYKMQNINNESGMMNTTRFFLQHGAHLTAASISLNGSYVRNDLQVVFQDQHATASVNGLYLADKNQRIHNNIRVDHQSPNCTSKEWYKGILDDSAEGSFRGYVKVYPQAHHTIAQQNNRNILLTDKAKIDSQPLLEIDNDDVQCSHGVTVGQLDENALYYLRTRGIGKQNATRLLMYAFCDEILAQIQIPSLKEYLSLLVTQRLNGELNPCIDCALSCESGICK